MIRPGLPVGLMWRILRRFERAISRAWSVGASGSRHQASTARRTSSSPSFHSSGLRIKARPRSQAKAVFFSFFFPRRRWRGPRGQRRHWHRGNHGSGAGTRRAGRRRWPDLRVLHIRRVQEVRWPTREAGILPIRAWRAGSPGQPKPRMPTGAFGGLACQEGPGVSIGSEKACPEVIPMQGGRHPGSGLGLGRR